MELYNTKTGKLEPIETPDQLNQGLADGTYAYQKGSKVPVLSPDGEYGHVPSANIHGAVRDGFKALTPTQASIKDYVIENDNLSGAMKVFLGQMADEFALGVPEMITDEVIDPTDLAKKEALKERHTAANALGGVTGGVGSLFYGGPLWKAATKAGKAAQAGTKAAAYSARNKLAKNFASTVLRKSNGKVSQAEALRVGRDMANRIVPIKGAGKVSQMAAEGAVVSLPHGITEAALGDPEAAGESLLYGVGLGALFGGGGALLGKIKGNGKKLMQAQQRAQDEEISLAQKLEGKADEAYVDALHGTPTKLDKARGQIDIYDDAGNVIDSVKSKDIKPIGRTLKNEKIFPAKNIEVATERIEERIKFHSTQVGEKLSSIDAKYGTDVLLDPQDIALKIYDDIIPELQKDRSIRNSILPRFIKELDAFAGEVGEGALTLRALNALKAQYQQRIKNFALEDRSYQDLLKIIPREINKTLRDKIKEVNPDALTDLIQSQTTLGNLQDALKIAANSRARGRSNNIFGLNSAVLASGGFAMGGLDAGLLLGGGRELARRYGSQLKGMTYDKVAGLLTAEQTLGAAGRRMDAIPQILKSMSDRVGKVEARPALISLEAARRFTAGDDKDKKADRIEWMEDLSEKLSRYAAAPDAALEEMDRVAGYVGQAGAPNIYEAAQEKALSAIEYLNNVMPKPPAPGNPFAPQIKWQPSDYELAAFERKVAVLQDPFIVLDELEQETLTKDHMEALEAVYPQLYSLMQLRVQQAVMDGVEPVPYQSRAKLSLLMGTPMDQTFSQKSVAYYQQSFLDKEEQDLGTGAQVDIAKNHMTDATRLS